MWSKQLVLWKSVLAFRNYSALSHKEPWTRLLRRPFRVLLLTREGVTSIHSEPNTNGKKPSCPNKTDTRVPACVSFNGALLTDSVKARIEKSKTTFITFNCSPFTYSMSLVNILRSLVWSLKNIKYICEIWFLLRVSWEFWNIGTLSIRLHSELLQ